jgi:16S rRNA processing protein RimM
MKELVAIAKIVKSRGLRGELIANVLTDFPERFAETSNVIALFPNGETFDLILEKFWFQKGRIILRFADFDSIEKAETLRGAEICVPENETIELEEDEFFDWQLINCEVETIKGEKIGRVKNLMRTGGTENLIVEGATKDYLIPFAETICIFVDIENKLIKIDPPDGLLEF